MEGFAYQKYLRVSSKKLGRLVSSLRGMNVEEALAVMRQLPSPHTRLVIKAIKSAYANLTVKKEEDISEEEAVIKTLVVEQSFRLRRLNPRARGRADIIHRRFSHLKCVVTDGS
ncbi:50S ribosomal protein L22 [candidate division WOR-3 bacterium JGI_Cruoil_03_44_89]|uniref:50S ribosomal protein L22 n=1 Tax=candidate division WOR-3 bacterium JGI_Cruoil_03_44_89 TaxID=1973748 RepID=A0A235BPT2_UNCW3|nr:MAG: 50S ribosomal protein L22 [candidate division WOR-3 bacterium JGI_Cruoil_03_44_89]